MKDLIHKTEKPLFIVKIIATVVFWLAIFALISKLPEMGVAVISSVSIVVVYIAIIAAFVFMQKIFIVAYMKGDGVLVSETQFPAAYARYCAMAERIGLKKIPPLFIVQQGGLLNAFAIRFSRKNYVAVYSDVFSRYEEDPEALYFVLGHELAHVRRNHMGKRFWTLPSAIVPFLEAAWFRACEYTCDNAGAYLCETGKTNGLLLLAGGADLYKKMSVESYLSGAERHRTAVVRFVELFVSHPFLPHRIENLRRRGQN